MAATTVKITAETDLGQLLGTLQPDATELSILSSTGWSEETIRRIPGVFPALKNLHVDLGDVITSEDSTVLTVDNLLKCIWSSPLKKIHFKYVDLNTTEETDWESLEPAKFLNSLEVLHLACKLPKKFQKYLRTITLGNLTILNIKSEMPHSTINTWTKLQEVSLIVPPGNETFLLNLPELNYLKLTRNCGQNLSPVNLDGYLPKLKMLKFHANFDNELNIGSSLFESNSGILSELEVIHPNPVGIINSILEPLKKNNLQPLLKFSFDGFYSMSEEKKTEGCKLIRDILALGMKIHPDSLVDVICDLEKFEEFQASLVEVKELQLNEDVHPYLLPKLDLLESFRNLKSLSIFGCTAVAEEGLSKMLSNLAIESIDLTNSDSTEFTSLKLQSSNLKSLTILHFHTLLSYDLHLPSLESLCLDNCDGEEIEKHPNSSESYGTETDLRTCRCYGNFGERLLKDFLNGNPNTFMPELKTLIITHNPNSYQGPPPVYEELRVDIDCTVGHPKLEKLDIYNCDHIKNLKLSNLPALREVSVSSQAEEMGESWLESAQLDLPAECKIKVGKLAETSRSARFLHEFAK